MCSIPFWDINFNRTFTFSTKNRLYNITFNMFHYLGYVNVENAIPEYLITILNRKWLRFFMLFELHACFFIHYIFHILLRGHYISNQHIANQFFRKIKDRNVPYIWITFTSLTDHIKYNLVFLTQGVAFNCPLINHVPESFESAIQTRY